MKLAYERKMIVGATEPRSGVDVFPTEDGVMLALEHEGHRIVLLLHPDEARSVGVGVLESGAASRAAMQAKEVQVAPAAALVGIDGGRKH